MSFDIAYDRNGVPIKPQQAPEFVDAPAVVEQEAAAPEVTVEIQPQNDADVVDNQTNVVVEEHIVPAAKSEIKESWKTIRDRMNNAEKRAQELEQALAEERASKKTLPKDDDYSVNLEEKRIKNIEQELAQYKLQMARETVKTQLKAQYSDWDNVFNAENLAKLEVLHPEVHHTLSMSNDLYRSGVSAYTMIKKLGIIEPEDVYAADKALAQRNASKPKSLASISPQQGDSPLSKANAFANGLTDDLKKQMLKEMNDARRGY